MPSTGWTICCIATPVSPNRRNMRVVIIGNGIAGNSAALALRRSCPQAEVVLIAEESCPLYSACVLPNYIAQELDRDRVFLKETSDYSREGINALLGHRVIALNGPDKKIVLESGEMAYDRLILAAGSEPLVPPIDGVGKAGIFPLKSIGDADAVLRQGCTRAVVVGSGPVGVEVAMALRKRGCEVSLIELFDRILPRLFDPGASSLISNLLREQGIDVLTGQKVVGFAGSDRVEAVLTDRGRITCGLVILALGMRPRIDLAKKSGIVAGALGGIRTDAHMATNLPDVYACGDCVESRDRLTGKEGLSLLWHNARKQGEIAGYNAVGISRAYPGSVDITVVNVSSTQAVSVGKRLEDLEGRDGEVIERDRNGEYYRLILFRGKLMGLQMVGRIRDAGTLLNMMLRGDEPRAVLKELSGGRARHHGIGWQWKVMRNWSTSLTPDDRGG